MSIKSITRVRRRWWWLALLLLVVVPFLPEIAIYAVTGLAKIKGCEVTDKVECVIGKWRVSEIIAINLRAGVWVAKWMGDYGVAAIWLASCYLAITFGCRNLVSRLLMGLVITTMFAVLPYLGPLLSIRQLVTPDCQPNQGGVAVHIPEIPKIPGDTIVSSCVMFGGDVGDAAHETVNPKLLYVGVLIALVSFVAYSIVAILLRLCSVLGWIKSTQEP